MNQIPWGFQVALSILVPIISVLGAYFVALKTADRAAEVSDREQKRKERRENVERRMRFNENVVEMVGKFCSHVRKKDLEMADLLSGAHYKIGLGDKAADTVVHEHIIAMRGISTSLASAVDDFCLRIDDHRIVSLVVEVPENIMMFYYKKIEKVVSGETPIEVLGAEFSVKNMEIDRVLFELQKLTRETYPLEVELEGSDQL